MKIWIDNVKGFLQGYSLVEQPKTIEVEVNEDFSDFFNYRWDGTSLIYDPENVPEPAPTPPTELELLQKQNAELMKQVSQQNQVIQQTQRMTGELMKQVAELTKGAE
ncbi:hypothetical protein [Enterococcus faecalis]|uniref:hypothetical protein n=2 Tax=Enterococcus faecalis TaxID=1351 RepID=UPI000CF1DBE6|nr:hypothetical protein [Enterococcus faecalis]EHZ5661128.1 hypothetical protein [Enterococcus faecalis]EIW2082541.1 hypothetical protein [Enterococcus faecalis]EJZ8851153.1 hypothetical protein [Enterococcus faecalis]EKZ0171002.1 hypothetical protein [Enterococcus faecalis]MDV7770523.1 hypothetical protein [Enterococcus faecalis]